MSWIQKLCEVYDNVIDTTGAEGDDALLPVGFLRKPIKYNIILSPEGEFVTAQVIPQQEQTCAVPTLPQAECRTQDNGPPFPLAEGLKYLLCNGQTDNPRFHSYLQQLSDWCAQPDAPECLHILCDYLARRTLYADLLRVPGLTINYDPGTNSGNDAKSIACFSIQSADEENRLWMRTDVRESWSKRYFAAIEGRESGLCYATGKYLPVLAHHPGVLGKAKLISAEDAGFPFRYKGHFQEDQSASSVSVLASVKAHNALRWLLNRQGFCRYGMSIVCWNTAAPVLTLDNGTPFPDEEDPEKEKTMPDTFEPYALALRNAVLSNYERLHKFADPHALSAKALQRMEQIVILGLEAATQGRASIVYYQEIPGNVYQARLDAWDQACRWEMPGEAHSVRPPKWSEICEAVLGQDAVQTAHKDFKCDKSATKLMRETQLLLIGCTAGGQPLPRSFPERAFRRAIQPLRFTDSQGKWQPFAWAQCTATACALARKYRMDHGQPEISYVLDPLCRERDYLYGRLLAVAHKLELDARGVKKVQTSAARSMTHFVQQPADAWQKLYLQLLPCLRQLGKTGYRARDYQCLLGRIERLFSPADRQSTQPLSYLFLAGFSAQLRELYLPGERQPLPDFCPYTPPTTRDELFGCLLAVADDCEWSTERQMAGGKLVSSRDGRTNAMQLTAAFTASPAETWCRVHDRLIPYLERSGVDTAEYVQRLLRRIEQGFSPAQRLAQTPLGSGFVHGYLCMRLALMTRGGLEQSAWKPTHSVFSVTSRDAAFGALLALEDRIERWVLDREKTEEDNRPSNAMRFLTCAAQRPDEVCAYLETRVRPYRKKLGFPHAITAEYQALHTCIDSNGWQNNAPLGAGYLYAFYTYEPKTHGRIRDGKEG